MLIILIGPVCAGKTTLALGLSTALGADVVSARGVIKKVLPGRNRTDLQTSGRELERRTGGHWLADAIGRIVGRSVVVDAARTVGQVQALIEMSSQVRIIYLEASEQSRRQRFQTRDDPADSFQSFDQLIASELPLGRELKDMSDLVVETDGLAVDKVREVVLAYLVSSSEIDGKGPGTSN
jgi:adenylosuccinate synthase